MSGYGRGYYGGAQLEKKEPKRRSWFTLVAVLGVGGAVAWLLWPRKVPFDHAALSVMPEAVPGAKALMAASPPLLSSGTAVASTPFGGFQKQLQDDARAQGFVQVKDFEDSVVASAQQLQASGARVVLAPHLEHLATRLAPVNEPSHAEIQQLWQPRDLRDEEFRRAPRDLRDEEFRGAPRPDSRDLRDEEFRRAPRPDPRDVRDDFRRDLRPDSRDQLSTRRTSTRRNSHNEGLGTGAPSRRSSYQPAGRRPSSQGDRDIAEDDLYEDTRRLDDSASRPRR